MLRTTLVHAARLHPCVAPSTLVPLISQRTFSHSAPRLNSLTAPKTNEQAHTGTEGPHIRTHLFCRLCSTMMFNEVCLLVGDLAARPSADAERSTPKPPTGNTTDEVLYRGDWVLFHPVYAPDELKSVEVSCCFSCVVSRGC